ncbi:PilN domain-containing protein [Actinoplanes sp. NPDC051346]|uniref:PilN domain-containing protein n=1 Tax=Actinoplanes sp. NPDC051346 TaxID=3155048 RepID=UPI0034228812
MATTLMPVDPAVSPQRVNRLLTISASLLPDEVVARRRTRRIRLLMIAVVVIVAAACGAWIFHANRLEQQADRDLTAAMSKVAELQLKKGTYAPVVKLRNEGDELKKQLGTVMANDLDWAALLHLLRTTGPDTVVVTGITGQLDEPSKGKKDNSSKSLPSTSKSASIGTMTVTGTAPDKKTVAAYVDALALKATIANPYVTSVSNSGEGDKKEVTFSIDVQIAQDALCGRFGKACKSGGK